MQQAKRRRTQQQQQPETLSLGPQDVSDLRAWPESLLATLCSDESRALRLRAHACAGIDMWTDYSGVDGPREGLMRVFDALQKQGHEASLRSLRTCDKGKLQTNVLVEHSREHQASACCHFKDIIERLPDSAQELLKASLPGKESSRADRESAFRDIYSWLERNRKWLYPKTACSPCSVHNKLCPALPEQVRGCQRIRVNCAGVTCHSWSTAGHQDQSAHISELPLSIWLHEQACRLQEGSVDFVFLECTPRFPAEQKLADCFGPLCEVVVVRTGPEDFGWPHRRRRVLAGAFLKARWKWVADNAANASHEFARLFYRRPTMRGSDLLVLSEKARQEELINFAATRKNRLEKDSLPSMPEHDILAAAFPAGAVMRLAEWKEHIWLNEELAKEEDLMIDLDHHPSSKGCSTTPQWPVQLSHGTILCLKQDQSWRLATGMEHFFAMGWDIMAEQKTGMVTMLEGLTTSQQKTLSGNSMHLLTQSAFMLFVISSCVRPRGFSAQRAGSWDLLRDV